MIQLYKISNLKILQLAFIQRGRESWSNNYQAGVGFETFIIRTNQKDGTSKICKYQL